MEYEPISLDAIPAKQNGRGERKKSQTRIGIEAFIESGYEAVEVKGYTDTKKLYESLYYAIRRYGYPATALRRSGRVFLVRR